MIIYKVKLVRQVFIKAIDREQAEKCAKELTDRYWESEEIKAVLYVMGEDVSKWKEDRYIDATKWRDREHDKK